MVGIMKFPVRLSFMNLLTHRLPALAVESYILTGFRVLCLEIMRLCVFLN